MAFILCLKGFNLKISHSYNSCIPGLTHTQRKKTYSSVVTYLNMI